MEGEGLRRRPEPRPTAAAPHLLPADVAFLARHGVPPSQLRLATDLGHREGTTAAEIVLSHGILSAEAYYRALARETGHRFVAWPRVHRAARYPDAVRAGIVPLDATGGTARFAAAPAGAALAALLNRPRPLPGLAITTPQALRAAAMTRAAPRIAHIAAQGLPKAAAEPSYRDEVSDPQALAAVALSGMLSVGAVLAPGTVLALVQLALGLLLLATMAVRLAACLERVDPPDPVWTGEPRWADRDLPVYTILIALYREGAVVPGLIAALARLDYPRSKLDIKLILEADDEETRAVLDGLDLPGCFETVMVPPGEPRGKPRALNVALPLARGKFLCVFDAEDEPEPGQLRAAVASFARHGPDVACLQARLTIDNTDDSWLTRLFTLEYAALFDVINPALARLELPVPLGGTSNHFRTAVLLRLGGWDAWNVTEDADLGLRFALHGYRVADLPSSTFEEAPSRLGPWLRQRIRWLKGFMQVTLAHSRRPVAAWRRMGPARFAAAVCLTLGTVLSCLVHPLMAASVLAAMVGGFAVPTDPVAIAGLGIALVTFAFGPPALLLPVALGLYRRRLGSLVPWLPLLAVYYGLVCIAAWLAVIDLLRPHHWAKTPHGLARTTRSGTSRRLPDTGSGEEGAGRPVNSP